jgi:hypothetical protein
MPALIFCHIQYHVVFYAANSSAFKCFLNRLAVRNTFTVIFIAGRTRHEFEQGAKKWPRMTQIIPVKIQKGGRQKRPCQRFFTDKVKTMPGLKGRDRFSRNGTTAVRQHILPLTGQ